jgi:AraC-like DNA-binding protein
MDLIAALTDVHPRDRLAYWRDIAGKVLVDQEFRVKSPASLQGTIHQTTLGQLEIVRLESAGLEGAARTAKEIARNKDPVFFLCLQLCGSTIISQDSREAVIEPGAFTLLDAQRPYTCRYPSHHWEQIVLKIPRRCLKTRLALSAELTARVMPNSDAVGGLVSGYLAMILDRMGALPPAARNQMAEHLLDLTALALAAKLYRDQPAFSSARALVLLNLRAVIENRLADPGLNPSRAAAAAGISVRYANSLLSQQGTSLERLIMARRLQLCRCALEDPSQSRRTVSEIAYACGFSDMSHFARRFKAEFGCSPGHYRRRHQE